MRGHDAPSLDRRTVRRVRTMIRAQAARSSIEKGRPAATVRRRGETRSKDRGRRDRIIEPSQDRRKSFRTRSTGRRRGRRKEGGGGEDRIVRQHSARHRASQPTDRGAPAADRTRRRTDRRGATRVGRQEWGRQSPVRERRRASSGACRSSAEPPETDGCVRSAGTGLRPSESDTRKGSGQ